MYAVEVSVVDVEKIPVILLFNNCIIWNKSNRKVCVNCVIGSQNEVDVSMS